MTAPPPARGTRSVLVLAGPSGAGKSRLAQRLAQRHGWPVLELDDFYLEAGDPRLPGPSGEPTDWDDVRTWDQAAARQALHTLCSDGAVQVPVYDIPTSTTSGSRVVQAGEASVIVAEGIFAAHLIEDLRRCGLLAAAWCIRGRPWVTFARRLVRDVREHRKGLGTLWRRGHRLRRTQAGIVQAQQALGAVPMTASLAEERARSLDRTSAGRG
ncbi:MAG: uridine kinase family protein [Ornithinimicrobium sp.]|uniref:uridine kinase family protein n=1 Tax=Ornithinimicrobium sp. TaxID=1977084 RepID=UPI003D9B6D62